MAINPINPLIPLQARGVDIGETFSNALLNVGKIDQLRQAREQAPARQQLLEAQAATAQAAVPTAQQQFNIADTNKIKSLAAGARQVIPDLEAGNIERVIATLQARDSALVNAGISNVETQEGLVLAKSNPAELLRIAQQAVALDDQITTGGKQVPTQFGGQQTFKDTEGNLFFGTTKRDPVGGTVESILAPIGGGTAQPVGQVSLVSPLGQTAVEKQAAEVTQAGAVEVEKEKAKLKFKPQIEKAVIDARKEAENRGEVFNELNQAKAALPSLTRAVDELRELSSVATSTFGGKIFDAAVKETGFGSTKGATARAKFIAIINNQVLPLLKPTFGGSFSVQEGESLKATMGDADSSPAEKMVQLDAFIEQKLRDIETKEAQLGAAPQAITVDQAAQPVAAPTFLGFE
jgi:hypothetical protein